MSFERAIKGQTAALEALILISHKEMEAAGKQVLPKLIKFSPSPTRKVHRFSKGGSAGFAQSWRVLSGKVGRVRFVNNRSTKRGIIGNIINKGVTRYGGEASARSYTRRDIVPDYVQDWWLFRKGEDSFAKAYVRLMNKRKIKGL